tara:strand:- start:17 stop:190 length:174 start_codon:yes stop_codon:yes gene_type:complete
MTKRQVIQIEVPVSIILTAESREDAFDILDSLGKEEILQLALHQIPFEKTKTSTRLQ